MLTRTAASFMHDLKARLAGRVQLTTDGHKAYLRAVLDAGFDADYAMLNKIFATDYAGPGRYSPPKCIFKLRHYRITEAALPETTTPNLLHA